jgi:3-methylfumaryl-CoA hydratase
VVHAPLTATLLMDLFLRHHPGAAVGKFVYLAHRPLFDTAPFTVNAASQGNRCLLWAVSDAGAVAMTAELEVA